MSLTAPLAILAAALAAEALGRMISRRRPDAIAPRLALAFMRPWLAWAVVNGVYRVAGFDFNTPETFPFFAVLWRPDTGPVAFARELLASPAFWLWSAAAWSLGAGTLAFARWALAATGRATVAAGLAGITALAALLPMAFAGVPLGAKDPLANEGSLLAPWFKSGGTMLYGMPRVKSTARFLQDFEAIQPALEISVHGASHPPAATLSLYWLGRLAGAKADVHRDKLRYAIALTCFNALAVIPMFLLGRALSGRDRVGLAAALLWAVKPAALAHNTFAQDGVYSVFFLLALWLAWRVAMDDQPGRGTIAALGAALYALMMLTFSWCIFAAGAAVFAVVEARKRGRSWADAFVRAAAPPAMAAALLAGTCLAFGFNYFSVYITAAEFVRGWYDFTTPFLWVLALAGGQVEWLIMMGCVVASLFAARVLPSWTRPVDAPARYGLIFLVVYALPLLFGPDPLKMETARCWSWMTALPIAAVAQTLCGTPAPRPWIVGAVGWSLFQYYAMRVTMCFLS
jgi:hypothetical protein